MPLTNDLHRRKFLHLTGITLLGNSVIPAFFNNSNAGGLPGTEIPNIALQLYTVRDQIKMDIAGTLKRIKAIGINHVETAFWPEGISLQQAAGHLKDAGLSVCSCHIELPMADNKNKFLETAAAFNCTKMIWHGWPEDKRYNTLQGTRELAALYNEASHFAKANGLQFGLHNHWWEFRNKVDDRFVYEVLLKELDPDIFFEIDTYWVKVAGHDPAAIVAAYGKRASFLHIKDGPAKWNDNLLTDNPDPMTAVGKGTQNFPAIAKAARGNTKWMIIEMDKTATDVVAAIDDSYQFLVKNKLAKSL